MLAYHFLLAFVLLISVAACTDPPDTGQESDLSLTMQYLHSKETYAHECGKCIYVLFFLRLSDFNCEYCIEDFEITCDELRGLKESTRDLIIYGLVKAEANIGGGENERLKRWIGAMGLQFNIRYAPDSIFEKAGFVRSCIAITREKGEVLFKSELPVGYQIKDVRRIILGERSEAKKVENDPSLSVAQ